MMSSKNILMIATGFAGAIGTMMALRKSSKEKDNSQRHHETNKDLPNDTKVNDSLKEADIVWGASAAQGVKLMLTKKMLMRKLPSLKMKLRG